MVKRLLPTLLALLLLLTLISAYVCFPPPGPLPLLRDCRELIDSIKAMARLPYESTIKDWSRHLATTPVSEKLPRWYYIERPGGQGSMSTCVLVVDVPRMDFTAVDRFSLRNVAEAADIAFFHCLLAKRQIGLEFPSDEGHAYVQVERLALPAYLRLEKSGRDEGWRRTRLPSGKVLAIADGVLIEGAERRNNTQS
ncbi:MAG: hypothetical protein Q9182_005621 [Xanthomendoza sp. 2 TL-2023]